MAKLKIGLVGFGEIGKVRARALQRSSQCELTAICDASAERRQMAASMSRTFESPEALLDFKGCDAIVISTPPPSHCDIATRAFEAGKHVLVEKPISNSMESAQRMLDCSIRADRILAVGFNHRYFKGVSDVREAVRSGAIGELRYMTAHAGHVGLPELRAPWMYDRECMGGGTLMDNGIHVIDLMRFIMGEIVRVSARMPAPIWKVGVEEDAFVSLTGAEDIFGSLHSSWTAWQGYGFRIAAYGSQGMAMMSYAPMYSSRIAVNLRGPFRRSVRRRFYIRDILTEKLMGWQRTVQDTFIQEFEDLRALIDGRRSATRIATGIDGFKAIAIAQAAYRSGSEHGGPVVPDSPIIAAQVSGAAESLPTDAGSR